MLLRFDDPSRVPNGCIQRAGENVLALVKEVVHSPYLADPGADRHGKVVFFDVLGLFSVVYPERLATILNTICSVASIVSIYFGLSRDNGKKTGIATESLRFRALILHTHVCKYALTLM